jgi:imidazolonepropionase-like amidohydrolase
MIRKPKIAALVLLITAAAQPAFSQIAVRGETVHTMTGPPITNGVILIRDGKVERVGPASQLQPPADYRVLSAKVVTPGLIDAHTVIGLSGYLNQPHDQMQLETSAPMQPELRAIDAYNARERLIEWVRGFGITTIHTGHAPGALISGQTMVAKTYGDDVDDVVMVPTAMIAVTLGQAGLAQQGRSPGTRSKATAMLRSELIKAKEYLSKMDGSPDDKKPARDLRLEALGRVIKREIPLLVTAHRSHDILTALRIAKEFDIRIILDGAAEAYLVTNQIKEAGIPVIIHPTMFRANGDTENLSMETASILNKAGITVALQSGFESYVPKTRVVLFEAALAAANGLSFSEALATLTINAAKVLGVSNRVGSIEPGKDADIALFDGDPFEYSTHAIGVIINGRIVSQEVR